MKLTAIKSAAGAVSKTHYRDTVLLKTHTINHLFNCSANRIDLTVHSLWSSPWDAATFLGQATEEGPKDDHEQIRFDGYSNNNKSN